MGRARRPNLYVVTALKRKYGLLKGQALDLLSDPEAVRASMGHLGAVLAMFDPDIDLAAIPLIRPYKPARGRWNRTALDILRKANGPLKTWELARLVMSEQGVEPDERILYSIGCSLAAVLRRLEAEGLLVRTGKPPRWAVAAWR